MPIESEIKRRSKSEPLAVLLSGQDVAKWHQEATSEEINNSNSCAVLFPQLEVN